MYILTGIEERPIMLTKVQKWGNSQGVRFPQRILEEAHVAVGDEVDVTVQEGRIVVTPSERVRGKYRLEDLVVQIPEEYAPAEEDWGAPVGREIW
jgi:antitoxin MazE